MISLDVMVIFGVIHLLAWISCARIVQTVQSRALGLTLGFLGMLACSGCLMAALTPLSANYSQGPHMTDALGIWPLPIGLVGLTLVRTRKDRLPANRCDCGYDLSGNKSGICPECGRLVDSIPRGS